MEKAILKTLIYADIFDYPLKAWEIHKWLVGKKASLNQVDKALKGKKLRLKVRSQGGFYFLKSRQNLNRRRIIREKVSSSFIFQAKLITTLFKIIPWVKLVGISGNLAMHNATKTDDIDLFIVTAKKRLWLSRICLLGILSLLEKRRKKTDTKKEAAKKICINLLLEEDNLEQASKNIYIAHEVLQMYPLWQRDGVYQKYLDSNSWVFKYLPNWLSTDQNIINKQKKSKAGSQNPIPLMDLFEQLSKWLQLRYMGEPKGDERIKDHALYFHPEDYSTKVLAKFSLKTKRL